MISDTLSHIELYISALGGCELYRYIYYVCLSHIELYISGRHDCLQPSRSPGQVGRQEAAVFVYKNRAEVIIKVREVMPIADELLSQGVIVRETYSNIQAAPTSEDKMRVLYEGLHSAGAQGKLAFYRILQAQQRLLVEDLWTA